MHWNVFVPNGASSCWSNLIRAELLDQSQSSPARGASARLMPNGSASSRLKFDPLRKDSSRFWQIASDSIGLNQFEPARSIDRFIRVGWSRLEGNSTKAGRFGPLQSIRTSSAWLEWIQADSTRFNYTSSSRCVCVCEGVSVCLSAAASWPHCLESCKRRQTDSRRIEPNRTSTRTLSSFSISAVSLLSA